MDILAEGSNQRDNLRMAVSSVERDRPLTLGVTNDDRVVLNLEGQCRCEVIGKSSRDYICEHRRSFLNGELSAVYVPASYSLRVSSVSHESPCLIAIVGAASTRNMAPAYWGRDNVITEERGRSSWRRVVKTLLTPEQTAAHFVIGETISSGDGVWSGYPPHRHDRDSPPRETAQDELFYFRFQPASGFAVLVQNIGIEGMEKTRIVRDGDICRVTKGYHSLVSGGGYKCYYLWVLAGPRPLFHPSIQEQFEWLSASTDG